MPNLRLATKDDLETIKDLAYQFYKESPYDKIKFDASRIEEIYPTILANPKEMVIILAQNFNKTIGIIIGSVVPLLWSRDKIATEIAWYVYPEYRGKRISLELLKAYEYWAKNIAGCRACQMASLFDYDKFTKLYDRFNYKEQERLFIKWL